MSYQDFLTKKTIIHPPCGFQPQNINANAFDFQKDIVSWACRRGRAALFAGTGLGKSLMQLSWAQELVDAEKGKVLILTPLAVAAQMCREAKKFGIEAAHVNASGESDCPIQVTNYQKIEHFDLSQYVGIILDESSILKNHSGHYRNRLIESTKQIPYRLAATATPSPNDYMELGNHSEFAGIMSYTDMLSTFFVHDAAKTQDWRLKGHAESEFWKWMASWAVMLQNPSDLGYDGSKYELPALNQIQHTVDVEYAPNIETGLLFPIEAQSMGERLKARRATIDDRVNHAVSIANDSKECFVMWCNLNDESAMLTQKINGAVEVKGSDPDHKKEEILEQFALGNIRVLVTKPSICGFGMNWQHCHNTVFTGLNDSFEQIYQAVRRFWRFGQTQEVNAHFIASEIEGAVVNNIKRKEKQAQHMADQMIKHMADLSATNIRGAIRETASYIPNETIKLPSFLGA
jgi:hypothetical protein